MRIRQTILVGAGGTGGWLAEPLHRLLTFHPQAEGYLTIIDGDAFEQKNAERQAGCHPGMNKAEALRKRIDWTIHAHPHYIEGEDLAQIIRDGDYDMVTDRYANDVDGCVCVILAVDNDATRKSVLDFLYDQYVGDFLVVNPGNGYETVTCSCSFRIGGTVIGADLRDTFPQYRNPADRSPTDGSCAKEVESTPQLLAANMGSAWLVLCALQAWLDGEPLPVLAGSNVRALESSYVSHRRVLPAWEAVLATKAS